MGVHVFPVLQQAMPAKEQHANIPADVGTLSFYRLRDAVDPCLKRLRKDKNNHLTRATVCHYLPTRPPLHTGFWSGRRILSLYQLILVAVVVGQGIVQIRLYSIEASGGSRQPFS